MTTTRTADGERLEISKAGFGAIRIESLDRNGTPNWGLTLTAADATEIADILATFAADITHASDRYYGALAAAAADDAAVDAIFAAKDRAEARDQAGDPFAGITDVPTNDPWDAS